MLGFESTGSAMRYRRGHDAPMEEACRRVAADQHLAGASAGSGVMNQEAHRGVAGALIRTRPANGRSFGGGPLPCRVWQEIGVRPVACVLRLVCPYAPCIPVPLTRLE